MATLAVNLEPNEEPEETPLWLETLLDANRETNNLLRELLALVKENQLASSTLVPSLLETNTRLTGQLQEMPSQMMALLTPLLSPPPPVIAEVVEPEESVVVPEAVETAEVAPEVPPEKPKKLRFL